MARCERPGCAGVIEESGFCDGCGRRPPLPAPARGSGQDSGAEPPSVRPLTQASSGSAWLLPVFEFPDPSSRILRNPQVPEKERRCATCGDTVGRARHEQPPLGSGYCPSCGHPFSFLPGLRHGAVVADRYHVIGCFARGGLGWVYLAADANLDGNHVVLKGVIDVADAPLAAAERRALTRLDHPNVVRIFDFVTHPDAHTKEPREYIVMEYVDGLVLSDVRERSAMGGAPPLGEPLRVEHVIVCGVQLLAALDYLHGRGWLYCDLKPENAILRSGQHGERANRVKLIDLGAVRKIGDRTSRIIGTKGYQVGVEEIDERGLSVRSDLHTVGVTLDDMFRVTADLAFGGDGQVAVGVESFRRVIARARHEQPDRRFSSAAQMADQLRGVHREIASLRDHRPRPQTSGVFAPTAVLLDAGLGAVPPLERWTGADWSPEAPPPLAAGLPEPAAAALGLPTPLVDPEDPAADLLAAADAPDPSRLLGKLSLDGRDSAEIQFARCRAYLELRDLGGAALSAKAAGALLGDAAAHDWRVSWHDGLLALARGDLGAARHAFDAVYDAVPGEEAPKLALGYCAEADGDPERAGQCYEAVWHRDRLQVSAAFGLARIRLSRGDRTGAVAILNDVPHVSRHADAAAIARVLTLSGRLPRPPRDEVTGRPPEGAQGLSSPGPEELREAARCLAEAYLDGGAGRDLLTAVVREAAFAWTRENGRPLPVDGHAFGRLPDEHALRRLLEQSYHALARQALDAGSHGVLVDRANAIRPITVF